jgi:hypothetical protein
MSRGGKDDYDENFPNEAAFWWNNAMRALKGKRGKKALADLREALLMLPEKRLVSGALSTVALKAEVESDPDQRADNWFRAEGVAKCEKEGLGVCAVGAYLMRKRVLELGETPEQAMAALPSASDLEGEGLEETANLGAEAGLAFPVAWLLADRNDETYLSLTPEDRYEKFLAWIDGELADA